MVSKPTPKKENYKVAQNYKFYLVSRSINSSRIAFFIAGLSLATWAPLIPLAKSRMMADNGTMGMVMLAFGIGSLLMMPISGALASRYGCRVVFTFATVITGILMPLLTILDTPLSLALILFIFGIGIGAMDVVANIHAVQVEKLADRPIMSGFHALFSIGGVVGSGVVSLLLVCGQTPLVAVSIIMMSVLVLLLCSFGGLLSNSEADKSIFFVKPKGIVVVLGALCFIAYIMEGSILDWSGILLSNKSNVDNVFAGIGYTTFALAMTIGRLFGDRIVKYFGRFNAFLTSSLIATTGFIIVVGWTTSLTMISGFFLIGAGLSNIVPILFSAAGRQNAMPVTLAVSAISSIGYSGILLGPALIGAIAHEYSLVKAFILISILSFILPLCSYIVRK